MAADFSSLTGGTFEGIVQVTGSEGSNLTASYWGGSALEDNSVILSVSQSDKTAHPTLQSAVEKARPGNVIEIADSSNYKALVDIKFNEEGLLLNGITLRNSADQTPTIDARELTSSSAAITVSDLERVSIEGLHIRGGLKGISFQNTRGIIRDNFIEDIPDSRSALGIEVSGGSAHIYGNRINTLGSTAIGVFSAPALIQHNLVVGPDQNATGSGNGVRATGGAPLSLFDNDVSSTGSDGQNEETIHISSTSALVKGNAVHENRAPGIVATGAISQFLILDNRIEGNDGAGITVSGGAQATIIRNWVNDNRGPGLSVDEESTARIESSQFLRNDTGINSASPALEVSNSLIAGSTQGDGLFSGGGDLAIQSSTIFGNAGYGIRLSGTSAQVYDSILDQNTVGDVSGGSPEFFQNNLIRDGQFEGINGNLVGDPMFSSPLDFDFSLQADSPAIDQGSDVLPFTSLDLASHERVFDGNGDGLIAADLGAVELGSEFWTSRVLPLPSVEEREFVGLAMVNAFQETTNVLLRAYNRNGQLVGNAQRQIGSGHQTAFLLTEAFSVRPDGWIEVLSSQPDLTGFLLYGHENLRFMDGSALFSPVSSQLLFPEVRTQAGEETLILLVNPHDREIEVSLTWTHLPEPPVEMQFSILPRGVLPVSVADVFGGATAGYVKAVVKSGEAVSGIEFFGKSDSLAALWGLDLNTASVNLYATQLASTEEVETTLNVINTGPETDVLLEVLDENGNVLDSVVEKLSQDSQLRIDARDLFSFQDNAIIGWLRVQSSGARLVGNFTFGGPGGRFLAALPLQSQGGREFIMGHVAETSELFSGLALLNPSSYQALVSIEVFESDGAPSGSSLLQLAPDQKLARLLPELIPDLSHQEGGFVRVRSNVPILGSQVFGNYKLDFLSAVSQQITVE